MIIPTAKVSSSVLEKNDEDDVAILQSRPLLSSISSKSFGTRNFEGLKLFLLPSAASLVAAAVTTAGVASTSTAKFSAEFQTDICIADPDLNQFCSLAAPIIKKNSAEEPINH